MVIVFWLTMNFKINLINFLSVCAKYNSIQAHVLSLTLYANILNILWALSFIPLYISIQYSDMYTTRDDDDRVGKYYNRVLIKWYISIRTQSSFVGVYIRTFIFCTKNGKDIKEAACICIRVNGWQNTFNIHYIHEHIYNIHTYICIICFMYLYRRSCHRDSLSR